MRDAPQVGQRTLDWVGGFVLEIASSYGAFTSGLDFEIRVCKITDTSLMRSRLLHELRQWKLLRVY